MAYNQHGAAVPQYTPEEIAYWESMGYVMDPAYVVPAPAPVPAYPQYPQQQQQQLHQPYGVTAPSIGAGRGAYPSAGGRYGGGGGPGPGAGPGAAGHYGHSGSRGPVGPGGYNFQQQQAYGMPPVEEPPVSDYEDLNKLFVDPKKAQEEADAAAALAEEEEKAAKAKAAATVIRKAAGKTWEDSTLLEFEESKPPFLSA